MAISKALNSTNDLFLLNGRIAMVSEGEQVVQHVRTRLQFYLGEWFLDLSAGTPWLQEIFVTPTNLSNIESILKARIALTPELSSIVDFSMAIGGPTNRSLRINFEAQTSYGLVSAEEIYIND